MPQVAQRSFCHAWDGCVSLRSTARPFAATLHFAPPEVQARRLLQDYVATHRTLAPAGTETPLTGLPLARKSDVCCPVLAISVYRGYLKRDSSKGVCCSAGLRSVFGGHCGIGGLCLAAYVRLRQADYQVRANKMCLIFYITHLQLNC